MKELRLISCAIFIGCGSDDSATNPDAPVCMITSPDNAATTNFDADLMLVASASDPQDGTLTGASVVWTSDLQTAPLGSGAATSARLPPGSNKVRCTATDSTGLSGSSEITVVSKSPYAKINHPGNNETRPANQPVPLVGVGNDLEDGALSGTSLVWTSSIDQALGTETSLSSTLSAGVHTITLMVTDSTGKTDSASITLTMQ